MRLNRSNTDAQLKSFAKDYRSSYVPQNQQLFVYQFPGTSENRMIPLKDWTDLSATHVFGIRASASNADLSSMVVNGQTVNVCTVDQLSAFTISFFDLRTKSWKFLNWPVASFIQNTSALKVPYTVVDLVPDMSKSYLTLNNPGLFIPGTLYAICISFYR